MQTGRSMEKLHSCFHWLARDAGEEVPEQMTKA